MSHPAHLILTHWPLDPSKQFLASSLSLQDLQPVIPLPMSTRSLGVCPFNWSEVITTGPDPVASVSFSLTDTSSAYVAAKLVPASSSTVDNELQTHTYVTKVTANEFNIQAVLPTSGKFILNVYLNEIEGSCLKHLCLSYIIENELQHCTKVGYPHIFPLPSRTFSFVPKYWNTGNKAYSCVNSSSELFSLVFEASPEVSYYYCLIRGRASSPEQSAFQDINNHQMLLVNNNSNLYKLLVAFPGEGWWTIYISGTRTVSGTVSGYTSLLTYHIFAERGSKKLSYPRVCRPGTVFFSSMPITVTQNNLTTVPFATPEPLNFDHFLTLDQPGSLTIFDGHSNIELDEERNREGYTHYLLNVTFSNANTWLVHVQSEGNKLFELKVTVDNPITNTFLVWSNVSLCNELEVKLKSNGVVTFTDDGNPLSFEFIAPSDIDFLHELKSSEGTAVDYCTHLTYHNGPTLQPLSCTLSAVFPLPGQWAVELFASEAGHNEYNLVLKLTLEVNTPTLNQCYPKIYPAFRNCGCQLSEVDPLLERSSDSGEFKLPFTAPSALYFFFKLENEKSEDFSQQVFVHTSPDSRERTLHVVFSEYGVWKLSMHANLLPQHAGQGDIEAPLLLEISVHNDVCTHDNSFPLLYQKFHEPHKLYFKPNDLPLPSMINVSMQPQRFSINYYSPSNVEFLHYAELKRPDRERATEDADDEVVPKHMQTRMVSNSTGLRELQVEVAVPGHWTVFLFASRRDVPETHDKWAPVMKYTFSAIAHS
jgi:hypothetical protein